MYYHKKIPEPFGRRPERPELSLQKTPIKTSEKGSIPVRKSCFSPLAVLLLFSNILKKGDE